MKKEYDITYCVFDDKAHIYYKFNSYEEAEEWAKENLNNRSYLIIKEWYECGLKQTENLQYHNKNKRR